MNETKQGARDEEVVLTLNQALVCLSTVRQAITGALRVDEVAQVRDQAAGADSAANVSVAEQVTRTSADIAAAAAVVRQELRARASESLEVSR